MAGRAVLFNSDRKGVPVAVGGNAYDMLIISGRFSLSPKFLSGT